MRNVVTFKNGDLVLGRAVIEDICYEHRNINISISCSTKDGFELSIFNKSSNIMRYYNIMDGTPKLTSKENVMTGDELMLRDDIRDSVFELIRSLFTLEVKESMTFEELELDAVDITALADALLVEFDLEEVEFASVMEWQKIQDVVSYIDITLES